MPKLEPFEPYAYSILSEICSACLRALVSASLRIVNAAWFGARVMWSFLKSLSLQLIRIIFGQRDFCGKDFPAVLVSSLESVSKTSG